MSQKRQAPTTIKKVDLLWRLQMQMQLYHDFADFVRQRLLYLKKIP